jgi:hypothetical protein
VDGPVFQVHAEHDAAVRELAAKHGAPQPARPEVGPFCERLEALFQATAWL